MKVTDILLPSAMVHTCAPHTTWKDAAELMLREKLPALPVVDTEGRLVGILSEKDLFRALFPLYKDWMETPHAYHDFERMEQDAITAIERTVAEVMSTRLLTASPETPILKVGALMVASGIHQVPVVQEGKLIGMVGRGAIYRAVLSRYFELGA